MSSHLQRLIQNLVDSKEYEIKTPGIHKNQPLCKTFSHLDGFGMRYILKIQLSYDPLQVNYLQSGLQRWSQHC